MGKAKKNPAAVVLGRAGGMRGKVRVSREMRRAAASILGHLGGLKGGKARAAALSQEELSEIGKRARAAGLKKLSARERQRIAQNAARARWGKAKPKRRAKA
jgi:hypothetical protein